jgi:hypothetical protein
MSLNIIDLNRTLSDAILKYASLLNPSNSPIKDGSLQISKITVSCDCVEPESSALEMAAWICLAPIIAMIFIAVIMIITVKLVKYYLGISIFESGEEVVGQQRPSRTISTNSSTSQESSRKTSIISSRPKRTCTTSTYPHQRGQLPVG